MTAIATDFSGECHAAVFCVGGAGANIASVLMERLVDADVITVNTEVGSDRVVDADFRICLSGVTAAGDVEAARKMAIEDVDSLRHLIRNYQFVHIVAGMGGGAGTGIAPVLAGCCLAEHVRFTATAVMPFTFETRVAAFEGYRELHSLCKENVNQFFNDSAVGSAGTLADALSRANDMVCDSVQETLSDIQGLVKRRTPPTGEACPLLSVSAPAAKS